MTKIYILLFCTLIFLQAFAAKNETLKIKDQFIKEFSFQSAIDNDSANMGKTYYANNKKFDGRFFIIQNDNLEKKGLLLLNHQQATCHQCVGGLMIYNPTKKPSLINLDSDFGSEGAGDPDILDVIVYKDNAYMILRGQFTGQGIVNSYIKVFSYNYKSGKIGKGLEIPDAGTDYGDDYPKCKGYNTKFKVDLSSKKPQIIFTTSGYTCDDSNKNKKIHSLLKYNF